MEKREQFIGFLLLFAFVFSFYLYTIAPTVSFWDCGEYIACGYILGVPHPPGSPLHVLLRRVFSLIPFAKGIALRMNILSSLVGALTTAFVYLFIIKLALRWRPPKNRQDKAIIHIGGAIGGIICAFSYTVWWNSVESEAYGLATFMLILCVALAFLWGEDKEHTKSDKYLVLIPYLLILSIGIHLTPFLAIPGILIFVLLTIWDEIKRSKAAVIISIIAVFVLSIIIALAAEKVGFGSAPMLFAASFTTITFVMLINWRGRRDVRRIALLLFLVLFAFTTYGYLIIRARANPAINEVAPTTFKRLGDVLARKQYGPEMLTTLFPRKTSIKTGYGPIRGLFEQVRFWTRYLIWQYTPFPRETAWERVSLNAGIRFVSLLISLLFVFTALFGMLRHFIRDRRTFWLFFGVLFTVSILFIGYMNFKFSPSDPNPMHQPREVRERHYFFGPSFVFFAFFIGLGALELLLRFRKRIKLVAPILIILAFTPLVSNFHSQANRRGNYIANDFGYNMLVSCDDGAVLFTNGDNDTFPLWYSQNVEKTKPTVTVANLSLLQTPWYIKQMKDRGVPISFTDYEIENLMPYPVVENGQPKRDKFIYTNDFAVRDILATNAGFKFEKKILLPIRRETLPKRYRVLFPKDMEFIHPSYYRKRLPKKYWMVMPEEYLLPSDKFAELVLKDYKGTIPIYFAGTVEKSTTRGFESYLRIEGLVRRVVSQDEKQFDIKKMMSRLSAQLGAEGLHIAKTDSLLNKVYRYRSIFDPSVYKYRTAKQMIGNYAVTYLLLGAAYERIGNIQKAIETMEKGKQFRPREITPFLYSLTRLYQMTGNYKRAAENLKELTKTRGGSSDNWYQLGLFYMQYEGDKARAFDAFQKARKADKNAPWGYAGLISYYISQGDTAKASTLLDTCFENQELTSRIVQLYRMENRKELGSFVLKKWLKSHPYDTVAQKMLKDFESK